MTVTVAPQRPKSPTPAPGTITDLVKQTPRGRGAELVALGARSRRSWTAITTLARSAAAWIGSATTAKKSSLFATSVSTMTTAI